MYISSIIKKRHIKFVNNSFSVSNISSLRTFSGLAKSNRLLGNPLKGMNNHDPSNPHIYIFDLRVIILCNLTDFLISTKSFIEIICNFRSKIIGQ